MGMTVQLLEPRRFMSAVVQDGVLTVTGTTLADDIVAYLFRAEPGADAKYVVEIGPMDGERPTQFWEFPAESVRLVVVRAGLGDDLVDLAVATIAVPANALTEVSPVAVPTRVEGGFGNDRIYGGSNRDLIFDVFGNDQIDGRNGDDWIRAGPGRDTIYGGNGNDLILGGSGNDSLSGGDDDDRVYGESGDDYVAGDFGNDRLSGGAGNDRLGSLMKVPWVGEWGDDLIDGGDGVDRIYGGPGSDRLFGGPGRDVWIDGSTAVDQDSEAERIDRTPDEPNEPFPPIR